MHHRATEWHRSESRHEESALTARYSINHGFTSIERNDNPSTAWDAPAAPDYLASEKHMKLDNRSLQQRKISEYRRALAHKPGSPFKTDQQHDYSSRVPRLSLAPSAFSLLSIPLFSAAYDQVEHDGKLYACQHRCSISHLPGGQVHIRETRTKAWPL